MYQVRRGVVSAEAVSPDGFVGVRSHYGQKWVNACMVQNWDYSDDDDDSNNDTGQQNQLPNAARKRMRELEKQVKEANDKLAEYAKSQRQQSVKEKVEAKGFDPLVAGLIPDGVDDVDAWLDQHTAILAKKETGPTGEQPQDDQQNPEEAAMMAAWAKLSGLNTSVAPVTATKMGDVMTRMLATDSKEALDEVIKSAGKIPIQM